MVSSGKPPRPQVAPAPHDPAARIVEILDGTRGVPDHPDIALTRLLISLEGADDAALMSALEELPADANPD